MKNYIFLLTILLLGSCGLIGTRHEEVHQHIKVDDNAIGNKTIDSLIQQCIQASNNGDYLQFKELSNKINTLDSNITEINTSLSFISLLEGQYNKALHLVNKSIRLGGKIYNNNYALKAIIHSELNNQDSAEFYFNKMYSNKQNTGEDIGTLLLLMDKFEHLDLIPKYAPIAYKYYPNNLQVIYYEATLEMKGKNYSSALVLLNKLDNQTTAPSEISFFKAICYKELKDFNNALKCIDQALSTDSTISRYVTVRGRIKQRLNDYDGAIKDYKFSISQGDTTAMRFYRDIQKDK